MTPSTNNDEVRKEPKNAVEWVRDEVVALSWSQTGDRISVPEGALTRLVQERNALRTLAPQPLDREALGKLWFELESRMYEGVAAGSPIAVDWNELTESQREDYRKNATQFAASLKGNGGCEWKRYQPSLWHQDTGCGRAVPMGGSQKVRELVGHFKFCPFCGKEIQPK